ncbi:DUF5105 domain-containing protein [Rummeliibacillus sp. NPDC094406]|uniref:DUF5105 domain-containing protein n=1 Tax=Rummeliibacillus sp. NPDC094406 TaxID=3364511 RepID=UPI00382E3D2E
MEGIVINKKRWLLISLFAVLSLLLTACGSSGSGSDSKQEARDVGIKLNSGEYIAVSKYDDNEEKTYLKLNLTVHNKSKNEISISGLDFSLYDKNNEKIESVYVNPPDEDSYKELSGSVSPEKKASGDLAYPINPEEKYELHFQPHIYDDKGNKQKELVVKVDPSKYKNDTENAKKAIAAYIDNVFLSKENPDFKTVLTNDVIKDSQKFDEELGNQLKEGSEEYKLNLKTEKNFIEKYRIALNRNIKPTYQIEYADAKNAKVMVRFKNFDSSDLYTQTRKVSEQFVKKNEKKYSYNEYDKAKKDALVYTINRIDQILNNTKLSNDSRNYSITMKNVDGKWHIQTTDEDMNSEYDDLLESFVLEM